MSDTTLEVGDRVKFTSYTVPDKKLTGKIIHINPNFVWRDGYTTLVTIEGDDGYDYKINGERVKKA